VVAAHAAEIFEVPVASAEILADLDTPEQYQAAAGRTAHGGN
jgi:hypothetical protein